MSSRAARTCQQAGEAGLASLQEFHYALVASGELFALLDLSRGRRVEVGPTAKLPRPRPGVTITAVPNFDNPEQWKTLGVGAGVTARQTDLEGASPAGAPPAPMSCVFAPAFLEANGTTLAIIACTGVRGDNTVQPDPDSIGEEDALVASTPSPTPASGSGLTLPMVSG